MVGDIKELTLILDQYSHLMVLVRMGHQVAVHHHKHIQRDIVTSQCFKNQTHIRMLVHLMLVDFNGDKIIQFNQRHKKLNHIKQQIK